MYVRFVLMGAARLVLDILKSYFSLATFSMVSFFLKKVVTSPCRA
jgi:hypothetical protein